MHDAKNSILNFDLWWEARGQCYDLWEDKMKNWGHFEFLTPKNLWLDMLDAKNSILNFDLWWEVRGHSKGPLRGQNEKSRSDLSSPPQKTYVLICMMQKTLILNFDLWCEVRGHCRWPLRGQNKKLRSFLSSPPQRTYVLICMMQKTLFWILTSDERSEVIVGDLWEVKMKNQGQIWVSHPKEPMFWYTWCKKLFFGFWPQMRGQRSFKWPLRGQIDWKSIFYPYFWLACSNRKK